MVNEMDFGQKIKQIRKSKGMSLEQVGDIVGVGKSTVRKWETGDIANMRRDKIALLGKALGVEPAYLMGWTDEQQETLTPEEIDLIKAYRDALPVIRNAAMNMLKSNPQK
jgi:repressor LexA